jgi:large subunit ribosomal protein L29
MTKQAEALSELRRLTVTELDEYLVKQRRRLFEVRFQQATGQVENHRQVREIRHEIARAMTVRIEIDRGLRPELVEAATAAPTVAPAKEKAKPKAPRPKKAPARLQVPAVVPAAVPVAETPKPAPEPGEETAVTADTADNADDQETVDG